MIRKFKKFQIEMFGKDNCDKCKSLKNRIDKILEKEQLFEKNFSIAYHNISTIEGLISFAKAQTVNGQRIPTIQISKYNAQTQKYEIIDDNRPESYIEDRLFVPIFLQLETDYSDEKRSVIKPKEIKGLLNIALNS